MKLRSRKVGWVLGSAVVVALVAWPLGAQEAKKADTKPADQAAPPARKVSDPARQVPRYFGQIGLSADQREEIHKIQAKHFQRIGDLQKQIAQMRAEMLAECEKVLNDTQKQLLESRRHAAAEKKARPPAAETPAPAKPAAKAGG
jgi:TolA-binding protein